MTTNQFYADTEKKEKTTGANEVTDALILSSIGGKW